jgi:hypothetical protein
MNYSNISKFNWGISYDSSYSCNGFRSLAKDINGDIYSRLPFNEYVKLGQLTETTPIGGYNDILLKISSNSGKLKNKYPFLNLQNSNTYSTRTAYQNIVIDQLGNVTLSGNLNNNQVIVGTDTAKYYGGNNDMFVMRYGNPCSNTTPLIAAGTPSGLLAKCNGTSLKASWQLLNNNEDKYYIYRSLSASGPFVKYDSVIPPTTTYIDAAVVSKTNYWYAISSHNIVGEGYLSLADSARLCDDTLNGMANVNTSQIAGQLYPNPTTDEVSLLVQTTEINATAQLQITNYIGQLLLDKTVILKSYNNFKIDVANYAGGIYLVTLKTPQSRYSEKLIVVK